MRPGIRLPLLRECRLLSAEQKDPHKPRAARFVDSFLGFSKSETEISLNLPLGADLWKQHNNNGAQGLRPRFAQFGSKTCC